MMPRPDIAVGPSSTTESTACFYIIKIDRAECARPSSIETALPVCLSVLLEHVYVDDFIESGMMYDS